MPTVDHLLYDVFTDTPFAGNPLAVAIEPPALDAMAMQRIAGELNLSETVFVRAAPGAGDAFTTRIFTPATELPFAGHPTIGAALALADEGLIGDRVVLREGVGDVVVRIAAGVATLTTPVAPAAVHVPPPDPDSLAGALGLSTDDLHPDTAHRWRARMFAPGFGIPEDPATGSAAAAACGFLAALAPEQVDCGWQLEQGAEMGRPSIIDVGAVVEDERIVAATNGGRAVRIGRSTIEW